MPPKKTDKPKKIVNEIDGKKIDGSKIVIKKVRIKKRRRRRDGADTNGSGGAAAGERTLVKPKQSLMDFITDISGGGVDVDKPTEGSVEETKECEGDAVDTNEGKLDEVALDTMFHTDDEKQQEYIDSMDEKEQLAMKIAIDHLGSSFSLWRSIGFNKFNK